MPALSWLLNLDFAGGAAVVVVPATAGPDYTFPLDRQHYTYPEDRQGYAFPLDRQHYGVTKG